jgi:dynein heavy chain
MNLPYHDWWKSNSGQVIILVSQVIWNQLIEDAFYSDSSTQKLTSLHKMWVDKLTQLSQNVTSDMEPWQRLALESLLTIEVHARDVIKDLLEKKVKNFVIYSEFQFIYLDRC